MSCGMKTVMFCLTCAILGRVWAAVGGSAQASARIRGFNDDGIAATVAESRALRANAHGRGSKDYVRCCVAGTGGVRGFIAVRIDDLDLRIGVASRADLELEILP